MTERPLPLLAPLEAIAALRAKGWEISFDWRDVWQEEHARAFTVAKAMSRDLLEDIRTAVDKALAEGQTLAQFAKELKPKLADRGWWGRKWMTDPQTGKDKVVQLGSPARLRTIYQANLRSSYMAGRWQRVQRAKKTMPFLRYVSVMDGRERPEHHAWHGTILPVDHPWWDTHFPPCGWGCRCDAQPVNQRVLDRKGWAINEAPAFPERDYINRRTGEVTRVELGIDPGWSYNVGKAALDALAPAPRPGQIGGEDTELQAVSRSNFTPLRSFFAAFGLADIDAAEKGKVWMDVDGWPMVISLGLFRGPDGALVTLDRRTAHALDAAADALRHPERIGLVWVTGKDGRALLVRRYETAAGRVDVARDFWRWSDDAAKRQKSGHLIWAADSAELAAFDAHQPRHPKGSRDGGRFRSTGRAAAFSALGSAEKGSEIKPFKAALLGQVSTSAAHKAAESGIDIGGRGVTLQHSAAVHIINQHGRSAVTGRERAMTASDILSAHQYINNAHTFARSGEGRDRMPRVLAKATAPAGHPIEVVFDVSSRNIILVTLYHATGSANIRTAQRRGKSKRRRGG